MCCFLLLCPALLSPCPWIDAFMYVKLCTHVRLCVAVRKCLRRMTLCEAVSIDISRLSHLMLVHGPGSFVMCLLKLLLYCIYIFFQLFGKKMNCFGLFSPNKCEWETKRVSLCSAQLSVLVSRNWLKHYGIPDSEFTKNQPEFLSRWCLMLCFLKKRAGQRHHSMRTSCCTSRFTSVAHRGRLQPVKTSARSYL